VTDRKAVATIAICDGIRLIASTVADTVAYLCRPQDAPAAAEIARAQTPQGGAEPPIDELPIPPGRRHLLTDALADVNRRRQARGKAPLAEPVTASALVVAQTAEFRGIPDPDPAPAEEGQAAGPTNAEVAPGPEAD